MNYYRGDLSDIDPKGLSVQKLGYSRNPWRVVITATGEEVWWEMERISYHLPGFGDRYTTIAVSGYRIKREAQAAMERLIALLTKERVESTDGQADPVLPPTSKT